MSDLGLGAGMYAVPSATCSGELGRDGEDEGWVCCVYGRAETEDGGGGEVPGLDLPRLWDLEVMCFMNHDLDELESISVERLDSIFASSIMRTTHTYITAAMHPSPRASLQCTTETRRG